MKPTPISDSTIPDLRSTLLEHYDRHARDLPWRRDTDPYRILVSEVMLQQTRVETVKRYYEAWLDRFPTLDHLARADEDEVLKAWEGLGYYRRARNLHATARFVRERGGVRLPESIEGLRELPGVGEYTSGAVASIAHGRVVPAVDGNVRRVFSRWFDEPKPKASWLRAVAASLVDPERPGDWNQALMELGATVCTPRAPKCDRCPVHAWCAAAYAGTQLDRPAQAEKRPVPKRRIALALVSRGGRVLLENRPPDGLLGGMWSLPEREVPDTAAGVAGAGGEVERAARQIVDELGIVASACRGRLPEHRHRFTHLDATYAPVWFESAADAELDGSVSASAAWVDPGRPVRHALPTAQRAVLDSWLIVRESRDVVASAGGPSAGEGAQ